MESVKFFSFLSKIPTPLFPPQLNQNESVTLHQYFPRSVPKTTFSYNTRTSAASQFSPTPYTQFLGSTQIPTRRPGYLRRYND